MKKKFHSTLVPVLGLVILFGLTSSSVTAQTYTLSIPPGAFIPVSNDMTYTNNGKSIACDTETACGFLAPVYLDQGMEVTKVTLYYNDPADFSIGLSITLLRTDNLGNSTDMTAFFSGDDNTSSQYLDTIDNAVIDNTNYAYSIYINVIGLAPKFYRAEIEYSYPNAIALPFIMR